MLKPGVILIKKKFYKKKCWFAGQYSRFITKWFILKSDVIKYLHFINDPAIQQLK